MHCEFNLVNTLPYNYESPVMFNRRRLSGEVVPDA